MRTSNERGIALITALLVMMLISALLVGFTTVVITDQRYRFIDKDRSQAFYGATAGVEKLTADLGNTFLKNVAPTNAQVTALTGTTAQPAITNVSFAATAAPTALPASELSTYDCNNSDGVNRTPLTVGANGYTITFCALTATNNPTTLPGSRTINNANSPYDGLYALKTPYQVDVTAKTNSGGEVHLSRTIEAVAVPVFQFGIFSDVDLAFHSGDDFAFGGRVHTNGNLFLAVGDGKTLTLGDKVTAYKDIIRAVLPNGNAIANNNSGGTVNMTKGGGTYRALAATEGSVQGGPGSTPWSGWTALSLSTYKGYIKNGANGATRGTGAKMLTLPIIAPNVGGTNIDVIRRPRPLEDTTSILYGERMFNKASIRVMLSDTAADITNIPGVDNTVAPKSLEAGAGPYGNIPIATPMPAPLWATTAPVAQITSAVTAGNGVSININNGTLPATLQVPAITVSANGGANQWSVTNCKDKSPTQFINCTIAITVGGLATIPINATVTAAALPGISA
ncbi:MAG TPA: hypothetical protein VFB07_02035, partial [Vicinamibacterales bacterium]|nr:hypothetical protein [Vicinamibacterales bacterium]